MVFYLKYRPTTIDELDNAGVRETLYSVLSGDAQHAFLFIGPKGLGKTSAARIVAKVVNCEEKSKVKSQKSKAQVKSQKFEAERFGEVEPCNECEQCLSITNGTNMDVVEIDAASNRGIDEIRDLREKIWLAPLRARKKVYIIDEVHMLTTEAFNALLKTLEEPPSHAMFILCTTEFQKIPATILSRCFLIQFMPATEEELVRSFRRIVKGEKIDITDDALLYIAGLSDRGFRDGVKILEEMTLVANGRKITKELVEEKYQVSSIRYQVSGMFEGLVKRDAKRCLEIVEELVGKGTDVRYFLQELIGALHEELLFQTGIKKNFQFSYKRTTFFEGSQIPNYKLQINETKMLYELFSKAYVDMKYAVLAQLPLELAVLEFMAGADGIADEGGENVAKSVVDDGSVTVSKLRRQVNNTLKQQAVYGIAKTGQASADSNDVVSKKVVKSDVELLQVPASGAVSAEWLEVLWKNIIVEMKKYNHTIAGVLRGCTIKSYDKRRLVIGAGFPFHKERLDDVKAREALKKVCKMLTGNEVEIAVELKEQVKS